VAFRVVEHRRPEDGRGGEQSACRNRGLADVAARRVGMLFGEPDVPARQQRPVGHVRAAALPAQQGRD
jgi:hypothetical protein